MHAEQSRNASQVVGHRSPLVFDCKTAWDGLTVMRWGGERGEVLDYVSAQHLISIPLVGELEIDLHTAGGRRQLIRRTVDKTCLLPAGYDTSFRWASEVNCLSIGLSPALVARAASGSVGTDALELTEVEEKDDPLVRQIALALLAEAEAKEPAGRLYAESLGHTLALHLIRHYSTARRQPATFSGGLGGNRLRRVREFINGHLDEDLTLAEIAEAADLSPYHFARAFKRSTGLTPQQYVTERRIERAKQLLAESRLPIVDVSAFAGFKNQSHFTTTFRRLTAMTPKAYREEVGSRKSGVGRE
jgi:AraC family transcriptional regulator